MPKLQPNVHRDAAAAPRAQVRVLAEKTNRVREVRELLDEEQLLVKAFQKRSREAAAAEGEAEREAYRRKVAGPCYVTMLSPAYLRRTS